MSTLLIDQLQGSEDALTVEIPVRFVGLETSEPSPVPIEFFMCHSRAAKQAFTNNEHFKDFVSQIRPAHLPHTSGLTTLGESQECVDQLVDRAVAEKLQQAGTSLLEVHITDRQIYNK